MKRVISLLVLFVFSFSLLTINVKATEVTTSAMGTVLYCVDNNSVLYGKNENVKMKMASTTKLMTALLTIEYAEKHNNPIVTFKKSMIEEGSSMYLKVNEKVTLKDLCVGMLLPSGNDAATASAIKIAGSKEKFAELMNKRAKQIGMNNTNFVKPSGLDDDNHFSTPYDMALLMKECSKNKELMKICGSKFMTVSFVSPKDKIVTYQNHNRLLSLYENCIGGKTGYTESAGRCLATIAKKNGITLIAVTLGDKNDWKDHINLYDYGFSKIKTKVFKEETLVQQLVGGTKDKTNIKLKEKVFILNNKSDKIERKIFLSPFAYCPIKEGDKAGVINYYRNGKLLEKNIIKYQEDIEYKEAEKSFWDFIKELFNG